MKLWAATCQRCGLRLVFKAKRELRAEMQKHAEECRQICLEAFKARMLAEGVDVTSHI